MPAARSAIERLARRVDDERATLERVAARPVRVIARNIRIAVLRAYARGQDPVAVIAREFGPLAIVVTDAMLAAHLVGRLRSVRAAESHGRDRHGLGAYDSALRFVHERLNLTPENTAAIAGAYGNEAARVTRQASAAVERSAQRAVRDIVAEGMHVNEGIARLRQSMDAAGIPANKPWILETLVRTNIQMAYSAGRFQANQDPAIDAILWGYEYVTVGDDRVRPEHAALEGVRLAKDSPRLHPIWPPNGWQCRCTMLEIYVDDPAAQRTESYPDGPVEVNVDGTPVVVMPGPDKGFAFNPGRVFRDVIPTNVGAQIPPPKVTKAKPPVRVPLKPQPKPTPPEVASPKLTKTQEAAVKEYTGVGHEELNAALRGDLPLTKELSKQRDSIDAALKRLPKSEGDFYRVIDFGPNPDALRSFRQQHTIGNTVEWPAFTSASETPGGWKGAWDSEGRNLVRVTIRGKTAVPVKQFSINPGESEVLFGRNTRFAVENFSTRPDRGIDIVLREL